MVVHPPEFALSEVDYYRVDDNVLIGKFPQLLGYGRFGLVLAGVREGVDGQQADVAVKL